jgi:hypothetical protein
MGRLKILNEPVSGVERLLEMAKLAGIENLQAVLAFRLTLSATTDTTAVTVPDTTCIVGRSPTCSIRSS